MLLPAGTTGMLTLSLDGEVLEQEGDLASADGAAAAAAVLELLRGSVAVLRAAGGGGDGAGEQMSRRTVTCDSGEYALVVGAERLYLSSKR